MEEEEKKPVYSWEQKRKALWRQLRPYKGLITTLSILGVFSAAANGVVPYVMGKFFDDLITPHNTVLGVFGTYPAWMVLLAAWALIQVIANGVSFFIDRKSRRLTTEVEAGIQSRAYITLLTLPTSFHKTHRTGEITDNISKVGWMLQSLVNTILSIAPQFLTIIIGVVISFVTAVFVSHTFLRALVSFGATRNPSFYGVEEMAGGRVA